MNCLLDTHFVKNTDSMISHKKRIDLNPSEKIDPLEAFKHIKQTNNSRLGFSQSIMSNNVTYGTAHVS